MQYALANSLSSSVSGLDPSAKAYIDAVVAAGAVVTSVQKNAINTFVKTGKTASWWGDVKRLYLPIWAVSAPNAIDIKTLSSGTFNGGVTHSSGYVQGNGTTGWFSTVATAASIGVSATGTAGVLMLDNLTSNTSAYGIGQTGFAGISYGRGGTTTRTIAFGAGSGTGITHVGNDAGIISNTRSGPNMHFARRRNTASVASLGQNVNTATAQNIIYSMAFMSNKYENTASSFSSVRYGAFFLTQSITTQIVDDFTLALKNMWETCTGLTLP